MELQVVDVQIPENSNIIFGMTHFIKSVEDIYEAVMDSVPNAKFGLAFCEASGPRKIRWEGNDKELIDVAIKNAENVGAGHSFILLIRNAYPINILPRLRSIPEITNIVAATANPLQVIIAETNQGRGILGIIDGGSPLGVEEEHDKSDRKDFLRNIGYKLG